MGKLAFKPQYTKGGRQYLSNEKREGEAVEHCVWFTLTPVETKQTSPDNGKGRQSLLAGGRGKG